MVASDAQWHADRAAFSRELSREDLKEALSASLLFGAVTALGHGALEKILPESSFTEATSNTVATLGTIATATIAVAGGMTSLRWRAEAVYHQHKASKLSTNDRANI